MSSDVTTPWSVLRDGIRLIWRFVKGHPAAFGLAVFGAALFAGAIIASAWVIGRVTDQVIIPILDEGASPEGLLLPAAAAILVVAVVKALGIVMRRTAAGWLQFRTRQDVRNNLLEHQLSLRMSWFSQQSIGDLLAVADSDVDQGTGVLGPLPYATGVSLLLVGTIVMISLIDPWLGLGALVGLIVVVVIDIMGELGDLRALGEGPAITWGGGRGRPRVVRRRPHCEGTGTRELRRPSFRDRLRCVA